MVKPTRLAFGKHLPDQPALSNPGSPLARNVIPSKGFWRPFANLNPYTTPLDDPARGAISSRDSLGNVYTFAGDGEKLYKLIADEFVDVSQPDTNYQATAEGRWEFIPWSDDILIAINGADAPQKINPRTGTEFEDLGGDPPPARHGAIVRSFVFMGNWIGNENKVAWSALDDAEEWNDDGTNQSDQQFLPSGGAVQAIIGGEVGIVFAQTSIHRFAYVGSPIAFQRDEIGSGIGLLAPGAVSRFGNTIFFIGQNSFYVMDALGVPKAIGESRWNKTFFGDLDGNYLHRVTSAIDPINTVWIVAYPSVDAQNGEPNRLFLYNWSADDCAFVDIETAGIFGAFTPGIGLDSLTDTTGFSLDDLPFSLDSRVWQGGGLVLAAFDRQNRLGFFAGDNLQAELETTELDSGERRLFVSGARPLVDAAEATVAIRTRAMQHLPPTGSNYTPRGPDGTCPAHVSGRYIRARLRIPAGANWSRAQGVDLYAAPDGEI